MAAPGTPPEEGTTLKCLHDYELEAVLHAAKKHPGALAQLASSCARFNELARKRIPVNLRLYTGFARQLLHSGSVPFCACRSLHFDINTPIHLNLASAVVVRFGDSWQQVEEVEVKLLRYEGPEELPDSTIECLGDDAATTGLLGCLQSLQGLAQLRLICPALGDSSMHALGKLTSLRSLSLSHSTYVGWYDNWAALKALQRLTYLCVSGGTHTQGAPAAVEDTGGPVLPPTLQELHVDSHVVAPTWWDHLAGCPDLLVLSVSYGHRDQFAECHPREVMSAAAQHCSQLTRLELRGYLSNWYSQETGHHQDPWHPCEGLAKLPNLRHIDCTGACQLVLGSADDWRVLGTLQQLTALHSWKATAPPPAGLQLPAVVHLCGNCWDAEGSVLRGLLQACPQLQTMDVRVSLSRHIAAEQQPPVPGWLEQQQQEEQPPQQQQEQEQEQEQQQQEQAQQQQEQEQAQQQQDQDQVPAQQQEPERQQQEEVEKEEALHTQLPGEAQPCATTVVAPAEQVEGAGDGVPTGFAAIIRYHHEEGVPDTSFARHFAAAAPGLAGIRELSLQWPLIWGQPQQVVPDLSALAHLETLRLNGRWRPFYTCGEPDLAPHSQQAAAVEEHQAANQQVVTMLLPVRATLQTLELAHLEKVTPRVALLLQDSFPMLTWMNLTHEHTSRQHPDLQEVVAALRPGLELRYGAMSYLDKKDIGLDW